MCGLTAVKLLNIDTLTEKQKKDLKQDLKKRKDAIQARLDAVNQALKLIEKKKSVRKKK